MRGGTALTTSVWDESASGKTISLQCFSRAVRLWGHFPCTGTFIWLFDIFLPLIIEGMWTPLKKKEIWYLTRLFLNSLAYSCRIKAAAVHWCKPALASPESHLLRTGEASAEPKNTPQFQLSMYKAQGSPSDFCFRCYQSLAWWLCACVCVCTVCVHT